jgi:RsiW-degrading membrane proteinase PrsW (M82 family)
MSGEPVVPVPVDLLPEGHERRPRRWKWLGRHGGWIVFAAFVVVWAATLFVLAVGLQNERVFIYVFLVGGFATSAAFLYTMCYRLRPADEISPSLLVVIALVGGFLGAVLTDFPDALISHTPLNGFLVGPVEEFCKIVVVVIVARWIPVKNARVGLFIGGAIGFGFAAFENTLYAFGTLLSTPLGSDAVLHLTENQGLRAITTMFGHPVWTGILAAAVYAGYRGNRLRITRRIVGSYLMVAALHDLWDFSAPLWTSILRSSSAAFFADQGMLLVIGVVGLLVWWRTSRRANAELMAQPVPIPLD